MTYCDFFSRNDASECRDLCRQFVRVLYANFPEFGRKVKIHLLLHLTDSMLEFGPTSGFNTER